MAQIVDSRCVLAVRDLELSTRYYIDVLGFSEDPIRGEGWSFLTRDCFHVMLGECRDEKPASELANHSYFAYWNIQGIDEKELMRGVQKLANRVSAGVIIAALIIGAAMLMRIDTRSKLFGYPSIAIVCFLAAALAGVWLIVTSLMHDLPQRRRHRRR